MTIISVTPDTETLSMTIVADLAASLKRAWEIWVDPRQLERWWGPPAWPATFVQHDVVVGGRSNYFMTGPEGEKVHGWWEFLALDEPHFLEFEDGFADEAGSPNTAMPTIHATVELRGTAGGTRMTVYSTFATIEQMEQLIAMGMVEGMTLAMGQIDALLAGTSSP